MGRLVWVARLNRWFVVIAIGVVGAAALLARRNIRLGVPLFGVVTSVVIVRAALQHRREAFARAVAKLDFAAMTKFAGAGSVTHIEARIMLAVLGGIERVDALDPLAPLCECGDEDCAMGELDREIESLVRGIRLLERGDHDSAIRELRYVERSRDAMQLFPGVYLLRPALGLVARAIAGRGRPETIALLDKMKTTMPLMRLPAHIAAAAIAHRAGEDVSARLREVPRLGEGSFLERTRLALVSEG